MAPKKLEPPKQVKRLLDKVADARERHRERHRPSGFGFAFADSIDYLDPSHWDAVASRATIFLGRDYLGAVERAGPENISPRYAICFRGTRPVAVVMAQVLTISVDALVKEAAKQLEKVRFRAIICGNLMSWGCHGVAFDPDEDPAALWPAVAEALYRIRRAERLSGQSDLVMVKDLTEVAASGIGVLERFSYRALETEPNMVLDVREAWHTYDDYLKDLTASYRKAARKTIRSVDTAGCTVERIADLHPIADVLHDLYGQVFQNARVRPVKIPAPFFPELAVSLGDRFRCTVVRREDRIVGFVTALKDGDEAVGYYIGFDRDENAAAPIYLRLLHTLVEDAIEWRCRRLSLGRTALEPKARLGCQPESMRIWLRHRLPAINMLVQPILRAVPHDEAPDRNPFGGGP